MVIVKDQREFRVESDPIEVTSLSRPDTHWAFTDRAGHTHRWYVEAAGPNGDHIQAVTYSPTATYILPTLTLVVDAEGDDEYPSVTHYECAQCGERIQPGRKADDCRQFIPGLRYCYIDGKPVSDEDFKREARAAGLIP